MIIPNSVKVGGIRYNVIVSDDWSDRDGADGETFYDLEHGNCIYIFSGLSQEAKEVTLIHEAMHCMNTVMNHEFLDSMAEQMYQFLVDNDLLK